MFSTRMLAIAVMMAVPLSASAGTFTTLYAFTGGADGGEPSSRLIYRDGALYGVTAVLNYADQRLGNVFKFDLATGSLTVVYNFQGGTNSSAPTDLIYHDGMFYGTTLSGGANGTGTVFALSTKTGNETVLYSFPGPVNNNPFWSPGGLIYENGMLFGATEEGGLNNQGTVFAVDPKNGTETTLYEFTGGADGLGPNPSLVLNNGLLYGTTEEGGENSCKYFDTHIGCGVVFSIVPTTGAESTVYAFTDGVGGFWPASNLIYHKGLFYGGTAYGGDMSCGRMGCGTFFSFDPSTGAEDVLRANTGLAQAISGLTDHGASVYETLFGADHGTHNKFGELVKFDLGSGHETVLHEFTNGADGSHPEFPLTYHNGVYYGTTTEGAHSGCVGNIGCGTIFQYVP